MNAAQNIQVPEPNKHVLECCDCTRKIEVEDKDAQIARRRALQTAREQEWHLWKERDQWHGRCPPCGAKRVKETAKENHNAGEDRTAAIYRRSELRASAASREILAKREVELEKARKRATRPIGEETAKHDKTMHKETPKLIHRTEFDRIVYGRLEPGQKKAADHFEQLTEQAAGVSDREAYQERVDSSQSDFGPTQSQLDARKRLDAAQAVIGSEMMAVADMSVIQDKIPEEIGKRYKWAKTTRQQKLIGMAMIKTALEGLADHWRLG